MTDKNYANQSTNNNACVTNLGDMLNWVKKNREEYVKEVANDFLHSSKGTVNVVANWHHNIDWSSTEAAEETHRRLIEVRIYDNAPFTRKTLERRIESFVNNVVDSKRLSAAIIGDLKTGRYTTATFRCGRVRIILIEIGC